MALTNITALVSAVPKCEMGVIVGIPEPETDKVLNIYSRVNIYENRDRTRIFDQFSGF